MLFRSTIAPTTAVPTTTTVSGVRDGTVTQIIGPVVTTTTAGLAAQAAVKPLQEEEPLLFMADNFLATQEAFEEYSTDDKTNSSKSKKVSSNVEKKSKDPKKSKKEKNKNGKKKK